MSINFKFWRRFIYTVEIPVEKKENSNLISILMKYKQFVIYRVGNLKLPVKVGSLRIVNSIVSRLNPK